MTLREMQNEAHQVETFGSLRLLRTERGSSHTWGVCRCVCGKEHRAYLSHLRAGKIKSCGCQRPTLVAQSRTRHGHARVSGNSPEYASWLAMIRRCYEPRNNRFARYGGRGISVCQRWRDSFEAFFADMGPKPTSRHQVDRIDNDGNYEPGNCRWSSHVEQQQNTSRTRRLTHSGMTLSIAAWSRRLGLPSRTIVSRLSRGASAEDALAVVPYREMRQRMLRNRERPVRHGGKRF